MRWEITHDPTLGTRVELTQTLPARAKRTAGSRHQQHHPIMMTPCNPL
ncbi:MAG: hypothetical protein ACRDSL_02610 [Pseudonocardiaceae bacterium]